MPAEKNLREEGERLLDAFNSVTREAGLQSAPQQLATGPSLNSLERAWLEGRDDTAEYIVGDLGGLIDEIARLLSDPNQITLQLSREEATELLTWTEDSSVDIDRNLCSKLRAALHQENPDG
jgi:hypothetical protein